MRHSEALSGWLRPRRDRDPGLWPLTASRSLAPARDMSSCRPSPELRLPDTVAARSGPDSRDGHGPGRRLRRTEQLV